MLKSYDVMKCFIMRHIPSDLTEKYSVKRLCFRNKILCLVLLNCKSITQRLDDYWFGVFQ